MTIALRVPPGRAGRIALRRRLAMADRGRDQLDRKLRMLIPEQQRQRAHAEVCRRRWNEACAEAQLWTLRAAALGGRDAIRHAMPAQAAAVEVTWVKSAGVAYPRGDQVAFEPTATAVLDNSAVVPALRGAQQAVEAAVRSACAEEAVRRLDAEVAVTRRRLRALDKVWLPAIERALVALELSLEQGEHEDGVRLRKARSAQADLASR